MDLKHPPDAGLSIFSHILRVAVFVVIVSSLADTPKVESESNQTSLLKKILIFILRMSVLLAHMYM